ncbi:SMI1/KNR4 family protein [Flavobacterium alkalisoli]|uniref:SMI1/KNR4 family protein n=1 Tax=Flavobacterium alkalisoli TaxID=2602769 RepID=A0A5B9FV91_9FLAO|nr:SMI1/KNR4 family protein [Flavobacterium alkalisoli]QEE50219.1 SMI1/KNR4 family protein [Flavobacterium alkalisoli]
MLEDIIDILKKNNIKPEPLFVEEINRFEKSCGVIFPATYKSFLQEMGKGAGHFMLGSDVFHKDIVDLSEGAKELIEENNLPQLPENAYVFWMHQGYQVAWFICNGNPNPDVYFFTEGEGSKDYVIMGTFTDFLDIQLQMSGLK